MIDSLAWILVRDRRLLSVRTEGKDKFYLPGGKREPGESDVAALCREIREELGVRLDPMTFSLCTVLDEEADGFSDGRLVHMTCYTAGYEGTLRPQREIAEARWLGSADAGLCPPAGKRVLSLLKTTGRID